MGRGSSKLPFTRLGGLLNHVAFVFREHDDGGMHFERSGELLCPPLANINTVVLEETDVLCVEAGLPGQFLRVQPFNSRSILMASPVVTAPCFLACRNSLFFIFIFHLSVLMRGDFKHANGHSCFLDSVDHKD